jgi:hypothetical protein
LLPGLVLFRFVAVPLQPGAVGPYTVQGVWSPAICCWRELVVSRIVGCNRWRVVHGELEPDMKNNATHVIYIARLRDGSIRVKKLLKTIWKKGLKVE